MKHPAPRRHRARAAQRAADPKEPPKLAEIHRADFLGKETVVGDEGANAFDKQEKLSLWWPVNYDPRH